MPSGWQERPAPQLAEGRPPGMSLREYAFALLLAKFTGSKVTRGGSLVGGFYDWWNKATPRHRALANHYAYYCGVKVERDGRDPDECAESGARALQERIDSEPREHRSQVQIVPGMIGQIMDVAVRINKACEAKGVDAEKVKRMHEIHGEMIARGCADPDEIVRVVSSVLGAQQELPA